jgi:hypothetical protein
MSNFFENIQFGLDCHNLLGDIILAADVWPYLINGQANKMDNRSKRRQIYIQS